MSMCMKIKKIFSLRITTMTAARHHVNLLYITAGKKSHYVLLKDLSRLVPRQYNNDKGKKYFCQCCLHGCTNEEVLKNHLGRWKLLGVQRMKLPEGDNKKGRDEVKFTKTEYQLRLRFVIYANFESVLRKQNSCEPSSSKSFLPIPATHTMWKLHLREMQWWARLWSTQVSIGDDAAEKLLD